MARELPFPFAGIERERMTMEAETVGANNSFGTRGRRGSGWQKEIALCHAALIATFVLGYTTDLRGLFDLLATVQPPVGAYSTRGDQRSAIHR
jgi:hypothetical protein